MHKFRLVFFKSNDVTSKRTEYHEAITFYKATTDANQMAGIGWESEKVVRLHEGDMSSAERKRFNLSVLASKECANRIGYESPLSPCTYTRRSS